MCWEGYAVTVAFGLGLGLLTLVAEPMPRLIAMALTVAAFGAIVLLTWEDPHATVRRGWRERILSRHAGLGVAVWILLVAGTLGATYMCNVMSVRATGVAACKRVPGDFNGPFTVKNRRWRIH